MEIYDTIGRRKKRKFALHRQEAKGGKDSMGKRRKICLISLLLTAFPVGCGAAVPKEQPPQTASAYVQAARAVLAGTDSFTADFDMEFAMNHAKEDGITATGTVAMVQEPFYVKIDADMGFADGQYRYAFYLEKDGDAVSQYMSYDGDWTEMTLSAEDAANSVQIYNATENMELLLAAAENLSMQKEGDRVILSGDIPGEKLYEVEEAGQFFRIVGMSELAEDYFAGAEDSPVSFVLEEKTGVPVSYEIDLADALEQVASNVLQELDGAEGVTVQSYRISATLTQLCGVSAEEIPAEVKNSAINYEKEFALQNEGK